MKHLMRWCALIAVLACAACGGRQPAAQGTPKPPLGPGPILRPEAFPFLFQWQQRVGVAWPTGKDSFGAVLQKRGPELMLVGLSPMGMPGFVLTLRADGSIDFENRTGTDLPFRPEYILADVQRVFFPWLPPVAADFSGERSGDVSGLHLVERYTNGKLSARTFLRDDAPDRGAVRITYEGWQPNQDAPARVVLKSEWFDYELTIETLAQSRLGAPSTRARRSGPAPCGPS